MLDFELRGKSWLNEKQVLDAVRKASVARLAKCAALVEGEAKRIVSKGATYATSRDNAGRFQRGAADRNTSEFPRLISGNLRGSIRYAKTSTDSYVVGPQTTGWYGRVHEFGAVIRVTPKMRRFLSAKFGWRVKGNVIVIPKRPFMRPALYRSMARFPALFKDLPLGGSAV